MIQGTSVVPGSAEGVALVTDAPFSFWGGYDHETGHIIDARHPLCGENAAGRVLFLPFTKGSSTTANVLLQAIKSGTAPSAIVTVGPDPYVALASIVAEELWGTPLPVVSIGNDFSQSFQTGDRVSVNDGRLTRSSSS